MKKKLAITLASAVMLLAFAGCTPTEPAASESPAPAESGSPAPSASTAPETPAAQEVSAAVFYYNYSDVYISSVRNAMDANLDALGVKYQNYDAGTNQATQTEQINTAIVGGANLLIVNIVETSSPDAAQNAVEAARTAGIPIIFFNREVADEVVSSYEMCAFVGTNAPEAGHMQGKMIGDYLVANYDAVDLNGDGTISYVMFKGQEGNAEAEARTQFGVEDANMVLTDAGMPALTFYDENNADMYLVDTNGAWSAQAAYDYMGPILAAYSEGNGNMIELIIANNDGMAEGAISGLNDAGYNTGSGSTTIPVFGVDATDSAKALINDGKMTGTIMQDAQGMADTISTLVTNVSGGSALMDNTDSYNVDEGVAKIRVPYGVYTGE